MHVVLLDPVAEDLCCSVALGEDELDEPRRLLLGRRLGLETTILLVSCGKRLDELTDRCVAETWGNSKYCLDNTE